MISVGIKEDSSKYIAGKLTRLAKQVEKPKVLYARWGVQGLKWIDNNFKQQGGLLNEGEWVDIKPATKKARRKGKRKGKRKSSKYGDKILMDSGELRKRFDVDYTVEGVLLGTSVPYAVYHESDKPRKKLPQRRMLPRQEDETMLTILVRVTNNFLKELLK